MATLPHTVSHVSSGTPFARGFDRIATFFAWIGERRARVQAIRELERLDERDLRDLRISPYDFDDIARGTFRR